nr:hypothetical protein [Cytophagales bacterium]
MKMTVLTFVFGLLLFSCIQSDEMASDLGPLPLGIWSNIEYLSNGFTMERVTQLKENNYGYLFLSNGKLVHRANSSWCGTPPIITKDYEGTWERNGDTITLRSQFWGGVNLQEWRLTESSGKSLLVEIVHSEWDLDE